MKFASLAVLSTIALTLGAIAPAQAANPNGLCIPKNGCMKGQARIRNGRWSQCGGTCRLKNPVNVRDMSATLYDAHCSSDEGSVTERVMFSKVPRATGKKATVMLTSYGVLTLEACR